MNNILHSCTAVVSWDLTKLNFFYLITYENWLKLEFFTDLFLRIVEFPFINVVY